MNFVDLLFFALLGLFGLIVTNVVVWSISRNTKKANHVKKGQTKILILSVVAYAIYIVLLVWFYFYTIARI